MHVLLPPNSMVCGIASEYVFICHRERLAFFDTVELKNKTIGGMYICIDCNIRTFNCNIYAL